MTRRAGKHGARRRWFAPEVVQTSAMDCGPAGLKCLLEGFGIPVSYGRLREACQTDVDGTSIDTLEAVAGGLGVSAQQEMIPVDHVLLTSAGVLPALVVVRHADGSTHFVVAWRRFGDWLQVMDPAVGRRWVRCRQFLDEVFRHEMSVSAAEWRAWAATDAFLAPLRERLACLGADDRTASRLIAQASEDDGWFAFGALDACIRLVASVIEAGGMRDGAEAGRLVAALFAQTCAEKLDIFRLIPPHYWSVSPDPESIDAPRQRLVLRGAVMLCVPGATVRSAAAEAKDGVPDKPLSPELLAALTEKPQNPLRTIWSFLRQDGLLAPLALAGAMAIAAGAVVLEALIMRGLFDIGALLNLGSQRIIAVSALLGFMALVFTLRVPIVAESLRFGRHIDVRLRGALLRKLPRLTDRYFLSRPISDMADRSHSIHQTRTVPGMGIHFVQSLAELALTVAGIALIDAASALFALAVVAIVLAIPAVFQPMINERDLRVRNHFATLNGFYLDALQGLVPIRTHRAEHAVRHQHESLLVEWVRSNRRLIRASTLATALQALLCVALVGAILIEHFLRAHGVTGADLLLVYWALRLPAIGGTVTSLAHQYPTQRSALLRLLEPLTAPETSSAENAMDAAATHRSEESLFAAGVSIEIESGTVVAAGHTILRDVDLKLAPGEHVAVIGLSGAGKSSLVGVLLGWHRLAGGRLLIDDAPACDSDIEAMRRITAWIDPAVQIWNKPLLDNVDYALAEPDYVRSAAAIDAAHLRGVLQKLPEGLQTRLGEGGALLSGGEGQRVRLARALAQADVRLALLDEPFRGLDRAQRSALLAATRRHWDGVTLLCVTHDVSETLSFSRVLVVEDGRIVEDGDPNRLARQASRYRELLETERLVRDGMWAGRQWRRVRVADGNVDVADSAPKLHATRSTA
jgi:ATP-binding cassette subfamily B protein